MSSQDQPPKRRSSAENLKAQDSGIIAIGRPLTPSKCAEAPSKGQTPNGASSSTSLQALDPSIIAAVRHATLSASQNNDSSHNISPIVIIPLTLIKSSSRDKSPQQAPSSKTHEYTGLNQDTTVPNPSTEIEHVQKQKRSKNRLGKQRETMASPNDGKATYAGYRAYDSWNAEEIATSRAQKKDADERMKRYAAIARYQADVRETESDLTRADIARDAMVAYNSMKNIHRKHNDPANNLGFTQAAREAYPPPMFPPGGMVNPYVLQYQQFPIQQCGYHPNTNLGNDSLGLNPMARPFVPGRPYEGPILPPTHNPNPPMNSMSSGYENGDYNPNGRRDSSAPSMNGNGIVRGYENGNHQSNGQRPMNGNGMTGGYENGNHQSNGQPPMSGNGTVGGYENGNHQSNGQPPMNQQTIPEWRRGAPYGGNSRQHLIPAYGSSDYGVPVPSSQTTEQPVENGNGMTGGYTNGNHYSNGQPPTNQQTNPDEGRYGIPYGSQSRRHLIPAYRSSDYVVRVSSSQTAGQPVENGNVMAGGYTNGNHYSNGQPPMNGWTGGHQNGGPYTNGNSQPSQYPVNGNGATTENGNYENGNHVPNGGAEAENGNYENGNHVPNGGAALPSNSTSTSTTTSTSPTTGWDSPYENSYQNSNFSRR